MTDFTRRSLLYTGAATLIAGPGFAAATPYVIPERHRARIVQVQAGFGIGEIHVDPGQFALYFTLPDGTAVRYPVGIGREERYVGGRFRVARKKRWPSWTPTKAMIRREPELYAKHANGMPGGPQNPLGAAALYLYAGKRDSFLRIHGTPNPGSVERRVSNGCVRMINAHIADLYARAPLGTRVVLH